MKFKLFLFSLVFEGLNHFILYTFSKRNNFNPTLLLNLIQVKSNSSVRDAR